MPVLYDAFRYAVQGLTMLTTSDDENIALAACTRLIDLYDTSLIMAGLDDDEPLFPPIVDEGDAPYIPCDCPICRDDPDFDEEVLDDLTNTFSLTFLVTPSGIHCIGASQ
jgi:hypothetical protein